jgi:hypothetical protein
MFSVQVDEEDKEGRWALAGPGKLGCCGEEKEGGDPSRNLRILENLTGN